MNNISSIPNINIACSGCGACLQACPLSCISMKQDKYGFTYPCVSNSCINCGKCSRVCPVNMRDKLIMDYPISSYIAQTTNHKIEQLSSSGGFCASLAEYWISVLHGTVFGCVMDFNLQVKHIAITDLGKIQDMQGSKYIQSDTRNTFEETRQLLDHGEYVLYIGVPCQIAGLRYFLGKYYERLLTVDLICHGVSSQASFDKYIHYISSKYGNAVKSYRFRNKTSYDRFGYRSRLIMSNGKSIFKKSTKDIFFNLYSKGEICRESCYQCQYAKPYRVSDITCGDCASRTFYKNFLPYAALSTVLLNTAKGKQIWNTICSSFQYFPLDLDREIHLNKQLHACTIRPNNRDQVCQMIMDDMWDDLESLFIKHHKQTFYQLLKEYTPIAIKKVIKQFI